MEEATLSTICWNIKFTVFDVICAYSPINLNQVLFSPLYTGTLNGYFGKQ